MEFPLLKKNSFHQATKYLVALLLIVLLTSNSNVVLAQEKTEPADKYFYHLLEAGIDRFTKTKAKAKEPEDLSSVISSFRLRNNFLSNQTTFQFQESGIQNTNNKNYFSYTLFFKDSQLFFNTSQKWNSNQIELRRYYDTNNHFILDTYINNFKETKYKLGFGPLDYFKDSVEVSLYYKKMQTNGIYNLQTRQISPSYVHFVGNSAESFLFYNVTNPGEFSYIQGTNKVITEGIGFMIAGNFRFLELFSFYSSLDLYYFKIDANLVTLSPSSEFYNELKKQREYVPQIINVNKNLNFNMNMYYELGFTVTFANVGLKWGAYWNLPLILDADYKKPKGYTITLSDKVYIQSLEQEDIKLFYRGDPSNKTQKISQIFLAGITFGVVSKL